MKDQERIVSYTYISKKALEEWEKLTIKPFKVFKASDGWVSTFMKRNNLSSLAVSTRASSRVHQKIEDQLPIVNQYKETFSNFTKKNGNDRIFNFDETSFGAITGQIRTVAPKNPKQQPKIKFVSKGRGLSIGCLISASGKKFKTMLVTSGLTDQSLVKYGKFQTDSRCLLATSKSGWFNQNHMLQVLNLIHDQTKGLESLCIWDQ